MLQGRGGGPVCSKCEVHFEQHAGGPAGADQLDKSKPWAPVYLDSHPTFPWCKVDSHQLNKENGSKGTRYKYITPNDCVVYANHVADQACDFAMGMMKGREESRLRFAQPNSCGAPLGLRYEVFIGERVCGKNTSKSVNKATDDKFVRRAQAKHKQGACLRAMPFCKESCRLVPRHGTCSKLFQGLGNCHSRSCYKDTGYRMRSFDNHAYDYNAEDPDEREVFPSDEAVAEAANKVPTHILSCPFCCYELTFPEDDPDNERAEERLSLPGPHGNSEHYHLYCREPDIQAMRIALDGAVDMASEAYCAAMMEQSSFDVTIDRLEILARELRELEMTSTLVMHSQ